MTEEEHKKLRSYYHSLLGQQRVMNHLARRYQTANMSPLTILEEGAVRIFAGEIDRIEKDFPGLLPAFDAHTFQLTRDEFLAAGILSYLAGALGVLEVAIETPEGAPVTQTREFSFVTDPELRRLIERDYSEIPRGYIAKCWKSVIVLSGGAIEAMLLDRLQRDPTPAKSAKGAPNKSDLTKWNLSELINICVELNYISQGAEKLSHPIREYRNLIHPGNEIRNKLIFDAEEAKIALEVLHIIHRDLSTRQVS